MTYEPQIRLGMFVGVLVVMALWERMAPRRKLRASRPLRWASNLGLAVLNTVVVRVAFALGLVGLALEAQGRGWGLFNNVSLPEWIAVALAVVALDLVIYGQHVLFHKVPILWRLHLVHHADPDLDVSSGVRFHLLEILVSLGIKIGAIMLLGAPPLAVLIFEVVLNATSLFNHSNVAMPGWLDRALRLVLVTPDMHRIHHSTLPHETNSNYGFNVPWWDWLFRTYRPQPEAGHHGMTIGLDDVDPRRGTRLDWMLALPFLTRRPR